VVAGVRNHCAQRRVTCRAKAEFGTRRGHATDRRPLMLCSYLPRQTLADRSPAFRMLLEYNPFYVLSALFMLGGLFALNDSLDWSPLPVGNVLILIATLNLYEMLLIGLAIFLYQRGVKRDGTVLLLIEAFFLVDAGFLNSEIFTQDLVVGFFTNAILLMLAAVKIAVIFHALGLPIRSGPYALALLQMLAIYYMPGVLKACSIHHAATSAVFGTVPAIALYAMWWVVGIIVALYGVLLRRVDFSDAPRIERFGRHRQVVGSILILGLVSILAHLCTSNWVYNVRWYTANLAPVLLGLAVALGMAQSVGLTYRRRMRAQVALPLGAIGISLAFPSALVMGPEHLAPLTPLRLVLLAAAAVYALGLAQFRQTCFGILSLFCLLLAALGSSVASIVENIMLFNRTVVTSTRSVVPKRTIHWGVVSVAFAFVLLGAGLVLSLKKRERIEVDDA
jgi:hypothetical protein